MFTLDEVRFVAHRLREIIVLNGPEVASTFTMGQVAAHLPAEFVQRMDSSPASEQRLFSAMMLAYIKGEWTAERIEDFPFIEEG